MNIDDRDDGSLRDDGDLDAATLLALRALRQDRPPTRDLWPGIAARLSTLQAPALSDRPAATPAHAAVAQPPRRWYRHPVPLATAAALVLALGLGWQGMQRNHGAASPPLVHAADALTSQYAAALRQVDAARANPTSARGQAVPALVQPDLAQLDDSAAQVRLALAHDPDARFLLARLQSLYARRLALSQRLATMG